MDGVMVDRVKEETAGLPEGVAVEEDMRHGPGEAAVGARGVIPGGWVKGCRIVGVERVVGGELESSTLENAGTARERAGDERVKRW